VNQAELAAERTQAPGRPTTRIPARGTILLVEDEAFVREITAEILESAGYRVLKARNAVSAKGMFERHGRTVQVLLTDVILPGQNGRDLAKELRIINPDLRVIFTSGYPENVATGKDSATTKMFYLPKPFSAESLLRKVWEVLGQDLEEIAI